MASIPRETVPPLNQISKGKRMPCMSSTGRIGALLLGVFFCACAMADISVERYPVWSGAEDMVTQQWAGFIVPAKSTANWNGFVDEGDRIRGELPGHSFSYVMERTGTYYLGIILVDDPDGTERLEASVNGKALGTAVASESGGKALFSFQEPVPLKKGDVLQYTCRSHVGYYRIYSILFAKQVMAPPTPAIEGIIPWSPKAGVVDICWTTTGVAPTGYVTCGKDKKSPSVPYVGRNHRIQLADLDPDREYEGRIVTTYRGREITSAPFRFRASLPVPASTTPLTVPLTVAEPTDAARTAWPATIGMPFAQGTLAREADLRLFDSAGNALPLQTETTCRWEDGSLKWVTLTFLADTRTEAQTRYVLKAQPAWPKANLSERSLSEIESTNTGWTVKTNRISLRIPKASPAVFTDLTAVGVPGALGNQAILVAEAPDLGPLVGAAPAPGNFVVEENGPCRTVLKCTGDFLRHERKSGWSYVLRLRLWRGQSIVGLSVTVSNNQEEPAFRQLSSLAVRLPSGKTKPLAMRSGQDESTFSTVDGTLSLLQDSDNHFVLAKGAEKSEGHRATGLLTVQDAASCLSVFMPDFWQTYPSGLHASDAGIEARFLPPLPANLYEDEANRAIFATRYAWYDRGHYIFRAGQTTQSEIYLSYTKAENTGRTAQESAWLAEPLVPQAPPVYLCSTSVLGRPLYPRTEGIWDKYDDLYDRSYDSMTAHTDAARSYGWMHYGDWHFGGGGGGNNEYDLAWSTGLQWMRTGQRRFLLRGLSMARHYSTVDTIHADFSDRLPCVVWKHSFSHVGSERPIEELVFDEQRRAQGVSIFSEYGGGRDPMGHIFEEGMWLCGVLSGDRWFLDTANHVCGWQARNLTPSFDFEIERSGGWALISMVRAYGFSGNPYYLNAARIMVQRCLERHDPDHGGWPQTPPLNETDGKPVRGGKAFATAILSHGLMRYLEIEPEKRPEVEQMLVNTADWLMTESWAPSGGFVYITNSPKHYDQGNRGVTCLMLSEIFAYALEVTSERKYRDFWQESMEGTLDGSPQQSGKLFSQQTRQTVFGLDRAWKMGVRTIPPLK
jgi:exo-rhamnogalacturonan lyase-like protein